MNSKLIFSPEYDLLYKGIGRFHPFDGQKYSKAWSEIKLPEGIDLESIWVKPEQTISDEALLSVHSPEYIQSLHKSSVISSIVEIPLVRFVPNTLLQSLLIKPMRYASEGTRLAVKYALDNAMVMNVGGGFHHAYAAHGEGFCVFADAAVAIADSRYHGLLDTNDKVLMIDLDAHRGNGFESVFKNDSSVDIFDMYNFQMYPGMHNGDVDDFPFMIPLKSRTGDDVYLSVLKEELPKFMQANHKPKLVFYNAGSDILAGDSLGDLNVSYEGVVERDKFVIELLSSIGIPTVIMTSGGYTKDSYKLIANLANMVIK